jgi:hypothetical protein
MLQRIDGLGMGINDGIDLVSFNAHRCKKFSGECDKSFLLYSQ